MKKISGCLENEWVLLCLLGLKSFHEFSNKGVYGVPCQPTQPEKEEDNNSNQKFILNSIRRRLLFSAEHETEGKRRNERKKTN